MELKKPLIKVISAVTSVAVAFGVIAGTNVFRFNAADTCEHPHTSDGICYEDFSDEIYTDVDTNGNTVYKVDDLTIVHYCGTGTKLTIPKELKIEDVEVEDPDDLDKTIKVTVTATVTEIADEAFKDNTTIKTVNIENNEITLGEDVFKGCTKLESINVTATSEYGEFFTNDGVLYDNYGNLLVYPAAKSDKSFEIEPSFTVKVTPEDEDAYDYQYDVSDISPYAFESCANLTELTVPSTIDTIENFTFVNCSALKTITFESDEDGYGVGLIYDSAIFDCPALETVNIPAASVSDIAVGYNCYDQNEDYPCEYLPAFARVPSLKEVNIITDADDSSNYCSVDGVLYEASDGQPDVLIYYPQGKTDESFTIPDTVTDISDYAFYNNTYLKSVNIPATVSDFSYETNFERCSALAEINVDEGNEYYCSVDGVLYEVGYDYDYDLEEEIYYPYDLLFFPSKNTAENYYVPDTVEQIEDNAFSHSVYKYNREEKLFSSENTCLKSISFPPKIYVSSEMLADCTALTDITFRGTKDEASCDEGLADNLLEEYGLNVDIHFWENRLDLSNDYKGHIFNYLDMFEDYYFEVYFPEYEDKAFTGLGDFKKNYSGKTLNVSIPLYSLTPEIDESYQSYKIGISAETSPDFDSEYIKTYDLTISGGCLTTSINVDEISITEDQENESVYFYFIADYSNYPQDADSDYEFVLYIGNPKIVYSDDSDEPEDSSSETDPETNPETDTETDIETDPETEPETEPETDTETEPETEPETETETETETDPDVTTTEVPTVTTTVYDPVTTTTQAPTVTTTIAPTVTTTVYDPVTTTTQAPVVTTTDSSSASISEITEDIIKAVISDASEGDTVSLKIIDDNALLTSDAIKLISDSDVNVSFILNNGVRVKVDASSITADAKNSGFDLSIIVRDALTSDGANNLAVSDKDLAIIPAQKGNFGMTLTVTIPSSMIKFDTSGKMWLYYIDDNDSYEDYSKYLSRNSDGSVNVVLTHASNYLLTAESKDPDVAEITTTNTPADNDNSSNSSDVNLSTGVFLAALPMTAAAFTVVVSRKKKNK